MTETQWKETYAKLKDVYGFCCFNPEDCFASEYVRKSIGQAITHMLTYKKAFYPSLKE